MGVVYYANYFVWMEIARVDYCRSVGLSYQQMEAEDGVLLAVAEAHCRYRLPALYDQEVSVRTWLADAHSRLVRFAYEMHAGGRTLAEGETKHIFCNRDMRPTRLPQKYHASLGIER